MTVTSNLGLEYNMKITIVEDGLEKPLNSPIKPPNLWFCAYSRYCSPTSH